MRLPITILRLSAAPAFLALGLANLAMGGAGPMAMLGMDPSTAGVTLCGVPVPSAVMGVLGSMWLMYLVMALFHAPAWIDVLARDRPVRRRKATAPAAGSSADVCILPDAR